MNEVADMFVGIARKKNHFEDQGFAVLAHSCHSCIRKHFSFPYTCNDGWPVGERDWIDRGSHCLNWIKRKGGEENE